MTSDTPFFKWPDSPALSIQKWRHLAVPGSRDVPENRENTFLLRIRGALEKLILWQDLIFYGAYGKVPKITSKKLPNRVKTASFQFQGGFDCSLSYLLARDVLKLFVLPGTQRLILCTVVLPQSDTKLLNATSFYCIILQCANNCDQKKLIHFRWIRHDTATIRRSG